MPWKKIYHTGPLGQRDILHYRNAEVVVPQELDLSALRWICCRSEAEKDTLLHLLPPKQRLFYQNKITATTRITLYGRRYTFIQSVRLSSGGAVFYFSPETLSPGPFRLLVDFRSESGHWQRRQDDYRVLPQPQLSLRLPGLAQYTTRLTLDDHLVYENTYEDMDIPF